MSSPSCFGFFDRYMLVPDVAVSPTFFVVSKTAKMLPADPLAGGSETVVTR